MYQITNTSLIRGHSQIAMLGGRRDSSTGRYRHTGWRQAMLDAGLDPDAQVDMPELMTQADGRSAVPAILGAAERPTALSVSMIWWPLA
jgi:DNA-binding LacI/PurR family transcriptional regulator